MGRFGHSMDIYSQNMNLSARNLTPSQVSVTQLCEKAKQRGCANVDLVNAEGSFKCTRHTVHYLRRMVKKVREMSSVRNGSDTDSLISF